VCSKEHAAHPRDLEIAGEVFAVELFRSGTQVEWVPITPHHFSVTLPALMQTDFFGLMI